MNTISLTQAKIFSRQLSPIQPATLGKISTFLIMQERELTKPHNPYYKLSVETTSLNQNTLKKTSSLTKELNVFSFSNHQEAPMEESEADENTDFFLEDLSDFNKENTCAPPCNFIEKTDLIFNCIKNNFSLNLWIEKISTQKIIPKILSLDSKKITLFDHIREVLYQENIQSLELSTALFLATQKYSQKKTPRFDPEVFF